MRNPLCRPSVAVALLLTLVSSASAAVTAVRISSERRQSFDDGWRFFKGDAPGAERPDFDDSKWRQLSLPHDWAIEGPFDSRANPHTGALPISGTGWYRKSFTVPDSAKDRYLSIMFDGAQNNAHVFLNGEEIGSRPYGYISFSVDLTGHLKFGGQTNVLAVRLTPEDRSSRWYPGAGIYRNVWLDVTGPVHVGQWGTYITTPEVSEEKAAVTAKVDIRNRTNSEARVTVQTAILDPAGKPVTRAGTPCRCARRKHSNRDGESDGEPSAAVGYGTSRHVHAGGRGGRRQQEGSGPLHHAVRHPLHQVRPRAGLPAERAGT